MSQVYDSFITIENKIYNDETIMSLPLTKSDEPSL
jgi:hypothetical protein